MTEGVNNKENEQTEHKVAELEQIVTVKESEIAALKKAEGELKEKLSAVNTSLTEAVNSYKGRIMQTHPGITEELISGDTIEAIDKSLEKALNLIGRVKKSMEKEISGTRVPAGAPGRRSPDLSSLSPREKIQYAIGGKK
ncbi:MAG: hypothetical protein PHY28_03050 [Dehalococcoidales bacterium]|nr:hypothetical protein [Dehalococcoidales bacterium]